MLSLFKKKKEQHFNHKKHHLVAIEVDTGIYYRRPDDEKRAIFLFKGGRMDGLAEEAAWPYQSEDDRGPDKFVKMFYYYERKK